MESGIVNISLNSISFSRLVGGAGSFDSDHQYYIVDVEDNTTWNLGTSSIPYSTSQTLVRNTDYWLFIGNRLYIDEQNWGSANNVIRYNFLDYNVSIWAYEPNWQCSEPTDCDPDTGIITQTCTDLGGKVPDKINSSICTIPTLFERYLGFEESYFTNVFTCQKTRNAFGCQTFLDTIATEYPVNWTVNAPLGTARAGLFLEHWPASGQTAIMDNFAMMIDRYASNGTRSLLLQYIPPGKPDEPVLNNLSLVECLNSTVGSFASIEHPYNSTLYIETNITFPGDFPEIRFDLKRCPEAVKQYDTLDWAFFTFNQSCGKLCYDSTVTCDRPIRGMWEFRLVGWHNTTDYDDHNFQWFNVAGTNQTSEVRDMNASTWSDGSMGVSTCHTINSTDVEPDGGGIFFNGTRINLNTSAIGGDRWFIIKNRTETSEISNPQYSGMNGFFNITLFNIPSNYSEVKLCSYNGSPPTWQLLIHDARIYTTHIDVLQFVDRRFPSLTDAPLEWTPQIVQIPQSDLQLSENGTFTIGFGVNPWNQYDTDYHCILLDNFRITVGETAFTEDTCISDCLAGTNIYRSSRWTGETCYTEFIPNHRNCQDEEEVDAFQRLKSNNTGFVTEDGHPWICINGRYLEWDLVRNELIKDELNSEICADLLARQQNESAIISDSLLYPIFGFSFGIWDFMLSAFMIGWYLVLIITGLFMYAGSRLGVKENWQVGYFSGIGTIIAFSLPEAGIFPFEFGFIVGFVGIVFFAYLWSKSGGS
jgi:hypothetical protein